MTKTFWLTFFLDTVYIRVTCFYCIHCDWRHVRTTYWLWCLCTIRV